MLGRIDTANMQEPYISGRDVEDTAVRTARLRKAAGDFEALFVYELLKTMRTSFASSKSEEPGFGKDIFMSIADQALAEKMSESGDLGITRLLVEALDTRAEAGITDVEGRGFETDPFAPLKCGPAPFIRMKPLNSQHSGTIPATACDLDGTGSRVRSVIERSARKYGLPADLIRAVIQVESAGNSQAVSNRGAKGLMQLTDSTAQDLGVTDVFDPEENIDAGSRYLSSLVRRFSGDLRLALAAYNAGPAAVERHGGLPPYRETIQYVDKVLGFIR